MTGLPDPAAAFCLDLVVAGGQNPFPWPRRRQLAGVDPVVEDCGVAA
jgi:hypothetical protein